MPDYSPPVAEMMFVLDHVVGLSKLPEHPDLGALDADMVESVLEPAAKLAAEVIAPLNWEGDQFGAKLKDGSVTTAPGFKEAYAEYRDGGWNAVPFSPDFGGQGLPWVIAFAVQEMWQAANMSFGLCPLLNQGAVDAIEHHGSQEQKDFYLEKLVSGEWTGTMNLTESQAGSDLSAIRSKAEPQDDGTYKVSGQKIYITYGEHDFTENIIHLVLARLPDAPEGVKGISLFIVPKSLEDGTRNDVICTGIEHKLGIHASPTCTMQFGDQGGATGYLVGEANQGLKYMFTMMNNARLSVGLQGVAIAERAYQAALAYAQDRVQGTALTDKSKRVAIAEHADVKRMLMTMKAQIEAARALTYDAGLALDLARTGDKVSQAKVDLLTPIVKSWATDMSLDVTSMGVQVHGGMGFVEETGAAQYYRDARILPIYEGTNGIQAADFAFRKVVMNGGEVANAYLSEISDAANSELLKDSVKALLHLTKNLVNAGAEDPDYVAAASTPYLNAFGIIAGAGIMERSQKAAQDLLESGNGDSAFLKQKIYTAAFYRDNILPHAKAYIKAASEGSTSLLSAS
ncbi:MAG: acyl-CoA dehydrogenase [Pseudomonadota bacterium]